MNRMYNLLAGVAAFWLMAGSVWAEPLYSVVELPTNASPETVLEKALQVVPSNRQLAWQELEFYAFLHFGPNTFQDMEWGNGKENPMIFNPMKLDARQWAKVARDAGMKMLCLTCKHHDGFCLWPTKTTGHSVAASPWRDGKGDVVRDVSEACREFGLKFGVYLSPWDRNHPAYGTEEYNNVFVAQLTELLTQYGPVAQVWFDGACGEGPNGKKQVYDLKRFYQTIRKLQPEAVISCMGPDTRWCGNEQGVGRDPEWSVLPVELMSKELIAANSQQKPTDGVFVPEELWAHGGIKDLGSREKVIGSSGLAWWPSEVNVSIRHGWFYHKEQDYAVKSPETLEKIYLNSVGQNATFLLNLPPDRRGLINEADVEALKGFKRIIDETFAVDLAREATVEADACADNHPVKYVNDGRKETYFTTPPGVSTATVIVDFKKPQTFDRLLLQEFIAHGQRVESFKLEIEKEGAWSLVSAGTTIGYKRILCFPPVTARKARVQITRSRSCPEISNIGFFKRPAERK